MKLPLVAATAAAAAVLGSALLFAQDPKKTDAPATAKAAEKPATAPAKDLKSRVSYAFGLNIGRQFKRNSVDLDPTIVAQGMRDGLGDANPQMTPAEIQATMVEFEKSMESKKEEIEKKRAAIDEEMQKKDLEMRMKVAEDNKKAGEKFLAENKSKPGVVTLPSGLQYKVIKEGAGPMPKATDEVTVHYTGHLIDPASTVFDTSRERGPAKFRVDGVIKGWTEALQLMKVGSKWEIYLPAALAYGANPRPGGPIPPNAVLVFDVELLEVNK